MRCVGILNENWMVGESKRMWGLWIVGEGSGTLLGGVVDSREMALWRGVVNVSGGGGEL